MAEINFVLEHLQNIFYKTILLCTIRHFTSPEIIELYNDKAGHISFSGNVFDLLSLKLNHKSK